MPFSDWFGKKGYSGISHAYNPYGYIQLDNIMTIRNYGLKILDKRAKLDYKYDLRRYDVIMRVFKYSGTEIGEPAKYGLASWVSSTDFPLA